MTAATPRIRPANRPGARRPAMTGMRAPLCSVDTPGMPPLFEPLVSDREAPDRRNVTFPFLAHCDRPAILRRSEIAPRDFLNSEALGNDCGRLGPGLRP